MSAERTREMTETETIVVVPLKTEKFSSKPALPASLENLFEDLVTAFAEFIGKLNYISDYHCTFKQHTHHLYWFNSVNS